MSFFHFGTRSFGAPRKRSPFLCPFRCAPCPAHEQRHQFCCAFRLHFASRFSQERFATNLVSFRTFSVEIRAIRALEMPNGVLAVGLCEASLPRSCCTVSRYHSLWGFGYKFGDLSVRSIFYERVP